MKTLGDIYEKYPSYRSGGLNVFKYVQTPDTGYRVNNYLKSDPTILLSDVIIMPPTGDGYPPRIFQGWYEIKIVSRKHWFGGSQGLQRAIMAARDRAFGPMGRGHKVFQHHTNNEPLPMTVPLYFWDEVDAVDVMMMLDLEPAVY